MEIRMVDLLGQYLEIKNEIDQAIANTIEQTAFINGPAVKEFSENLAKYQNINHVIPCASGTEALQIALMGIDLQPGDEVIIPAFTYIATAEVIALLKAVPVLVDVDPKNFNIKPQDIEKAITPRTKAIIPVHLYGQAANMEPILQIAKEYNLYVIEDNAQSIGARYTFSDGSSKKTGTIGHIGCTSFFPSKNLGAYGDGGAIFTDDPDLAQKMKMIANHGQNKKYYHQLVGLNSRLDTIQAAILNVKLKYLDKYNNARFSAAQAYTERLKNIPQLTLPSIMPYSTHVFHQYTLIINTDQRDQLKQYLADNGIPSQIYYPMPIHHQQAYKNLVKTPVPLPNSQMLSQHVLSLPMHTQLTIDQIDYITETIKNFFKNN